MDGNTAVVLIIVAIVVGSVVANITDAIREKYKNNK